jgi:hypothetical protein
MTYTMCDCPKYEGPHDPSMRCVLWARNGERERCAMVCKDVEIHFRTLAARYAAELPPARLESNTATSCAEAIVMCLAAIRREPDADG